MVQRLVKEGLNQTNDPSEAGPNTFKIKKSQFRPGKEATLTKSNLQASVKRNKVIA